ncbi:hypothetical protein H0X48_04320 [Candidatus Dependentiae bacterium]|nr:hypothetical protein [Candidatus Dependentiae bacterium]
MKATLKKLAVEVQYIVDKKGKKTAVILDIKTFKQLLEEIEDVYLGKLAELALSQDPEYVSHKDVLKAISQKK